MNVLEFEGIRRAYTKGVNVLDGVSFSVEPSQVVGLLAADIEASAGGGTRAPLLPAGVCRLRDRDDHRLGSEVPSGVRQLRRRRPRLPCHGAVARVRAGPGRPAAAGRVALGRVARARGGDAVCRSRAAAYSPYSAPPGSSARFVALQISRAVETVYGVSIGPETIEERYLIRRKDGSVVPRGEGLTLRKDYSILTPKSGPMFPALVALTAVPWLLLIALLLRAYRAGIREWVRQTIVWGSLAVLLGFVFATSIADIFEVMQQWAIRALVEVPVMRLGQTAAGTLAVWIVAGLLLAAAYRIVQRQFVHMEIPTKPSRYTLIRIGQD